MNAVMVDLETWGTRTSSQLRSIGAVVFDTESRQTFEGLLHQAFYVNVAGYADGPFTVDEDTFRWWSQQSNEAQRAFSNPAPIDPGEAVASLSTWLNGMEFEEIWANPPRFDLAILEYHFDWFRIDVPWNHWDERDVRTVLARSNMLRREDRPMPVGMIAHRADHDAAGQSMWVQVCSGGL